MIVWEASGVDKLRSRRQRKDDFLSAERSQEKRAGGIDDEGAGEEGSAMGEGDGFGGARGWRELMEG